MNESLIISGNFDTPKIIFDTQIDSFEISGRSLPEDASEFYTPLISWIQKYVKKPKRITRINFRLDYYNSASARNLLEIVLLLAETQQSGKQLICNWYYEIGDEQMMEAGEEMASLSEIKMNMMAVKNL